MHTTSPALLIRAPRHDSNSPSPIETKNGNRVEPSGTLLDQCTHIWSTSGPHCGLYW
jgi:hypothetical protein